MRIAARMNFAFCSKTKISAENAENVVKLPRNPVLMAIFVVSSKLLLSEMYAKATPIRQAPRMLDTKIPEEKSLFIGLKTTFK